MDKNRDFDIYFNNDDILDIDRDLIYRRKVLHSRILKLSSAKSKFSYGVMGIALSNSAKPQESVFPLQKAAIINPTYSKIQIRLAESLLKLGKVNEGLDSLKKALSFSPQAGPLHRLLIEILEENHRLEDLDSFVKEIARVITDQTALQDFYIVNAETLLHCNKYPQALASYHKAIEANSVMEDYYHYNYGLALYHEGLFEEAIVQFEHAWKLNPTEKLAFNNIVHINYCLGRIEKALEGYEEIFKNGLEVHYTYSNYILVLYHLDKDEEVINKYKDLLQPYIQSHGHILLKLYQEELRITQATLEKDSIDEETKEFNRRKLQGINLLLSLLD